MANIFDNNKRYINNDMKKEIEAQIFEDAKACGSLKDAVLAHQEAYEEAYLAHGASKAVDADGDDWVDGTSTGDKYMYDTASSSKYGVGNWELLFPEVQAVTDKPTWFDTDKSWVKTVMDGTKHTPFSRVKSWYADITGEEAKARGYVKGTRKITEVFKVLKRETYPQTIYKKQQLDRDDIIDISFDVVAWIKSEMRMKLNEAIAQAILLGGVADIDTTHIRPILLDDELYSMKKTYEAGANYKEETDNIIEAAIRARKDYQGSGNIRCFTTEDTLATMLLAQDLNGRRIYESEAALATAMRVSGITTVPEMDNLFITKNVDGTYARVDADDAEAGDIEVTAILVGLSDYNVGAEKGGNVAMFDDFDIDFNQQKYLIETRLSGALIKPMSAIVLGKVVAEAGE
jgi:hypothetical protein